MTGLREGGNCLMDEMYFLELWFIYTGAKDMPLKERLAAKRKSCTHDVGFLIYIISTNEFIYLGHDKAVYLYLDEPTALVDDDDFITETVPLCEFDPAEKYSDEILAYIDIVKRKASFEQTPLLYEKESAIKSALMTLKKKHIITRMLSSKAGRGIKLKKRLLLYTKKIAKFFVTFLEALNQKIPSAIAAGVFTLFLTVFVVPYLNIQYFEKSTFAKDRSELHKSYSHNFAEFRIAAEQLINLCHKFKDQSELVKKSEGFYQRRHELYLSQRDKAIEWVSGASDISYYFGNDLLQLHRKFTDWYGLRDEKDYCEWANSVDVNEVTVWEKKILRLIRDKLYNLNS